MATLLNTESGSAPFTADSDPKNSFLESHYKFEKYDDFLKYATDCVKEADTQFVIECWHNPTTSHGTPWRISLYENISSVCPPPRDNVCTTVDAFVLHAGNFGSSDLRGKFYFVPRGKFYCAQHAK
jgi:hypothetical protein